MRYLMLIYETDNAFADRESELTGEFWGAWHSYTEALLDSGVYIGGSPLERPATASTVRVQDDKRVVHDGPFADTKEQLGGYALLEVSSEEEALEWAARCPAARYGAVEIRPISLTDEERVFRGTPPRVERE